MNRQVEKLQEKINAAVTYHEDVKDELGIKSKGKVSSLLKKGEGKHWTFYKEGKAHFYKPIPSVQKSSIYIKDYRTDPNYQSEVKETDATFESQQTLDKSQQSKSPAMSQTGRTDEVISVLEVLE